MCNCAVIEAVDYRLVFHALVEHIERALTNPRPILQCPFSERGFSQHPGEAADVRRTSVLLDRSAGRPDPQRAFDEATRRISLPPSSVLPRPLLCELNHHLFSGVFKSLQGFSRDNV